MILAGDFVPQEASFELPDFGDELVLSNLEGPVCGDALPPLEKVGKHLHSRPFDLAGRWAFTLANNHLMDFRAEGLRETQAFLREKGFLFGGAGEDEEAARRTLWLSDQGKRIAVICCCEHQFGVAGPRSPGVAAQGDWVADAICRARQDGADVVIVSSHAGSESTKLVSPRLQSLYRHWIDSGADVIHGHHAHVPQGWEEYNGKPIFYGLGNFIVKHDDWADDGNQLWSLVARLDLSGRRLRYEVEPFGEVQPSWRSYVEEANQIFADVHEMEKRWRENAVMQYERYYKPYLEFSVRSMFLFALHPRRMRLVRLNFAQCENHVDIIRTARDVTRMKGS